MSTGLRLDPFAAVDGRYEDESVIVTPGRDHGVTAHRRDDGRIAVRHRLTILDDDLAEELAAALGPLTDQWDVFARAFTGIVVTSDADPLAAWERFYRNSLRPHRGGYAEIYRHALALLPRTSVLDLGCGFGFLALHLCGLGAEVHATDIDPGSLHLLQVMSGRLRLPVRISAESSETVDAVALLHVLEHVDDPQAVLATALRTARHRVVVAVPYEQRPTALFGHRHCFDAAALRALGAATGWTYDVHEHHGGWLVLDHPSG